MVEIINRQRQVSLDCERWQGFTARALGVVQSPSAEVTVVFVSDRRMAELNRTWRGKRGTTDVLSFPSGDEKGQILGDIVISVGRAKDQARANDLSFEAEISQLILHGLLHLCGYDHETDEGEMNRLELKLRRKLRI